MNQANMHSPTEIIALEHKILDGASVAGRNYVCDNIDIVEFDRLAAEFSDACIDQIALYKNLTTSGQKHLFLSFKDGRVVGGAVIVVYSLPFLGGGIANVRFGPFWRRQKEPQDEQTYRVIIEQLVEEFCQKRGLMLTILPRPHPEYAQQESDCLKSLDFISRQSPSASYRLFANANLPEIEQMASFSQKWRYNLKKSLKSDVEVILAESKDDFETFGAIHRAMLSRKNIQLSDVVDIIPQLQALMSPKITPKVYLAYLNGEAVAGTAIVRVGDTAHYLYGASADKALSVNASYALQWAILNDLRKEGFQYYDLGGSSGFDGLLQFKSGLIGKRGIEVDMPLEHNYSASLRASLSGSIIHLLRYAKSNTLRLTNKLRRV